MPKSKANELESLTSGIYSTGLELVKHRPKRKKLRGGFLGLILSVAAPMLIDYAIGRSQEDKQRQAEADQARRDWEEAEAERKRRDAELEAERSARFAELEQRRKNQSELGRQIEAEKTMTKQQRAMSQRQRQAQLEAEQRQLAMVQGRRTREQQSAQFLNNQQRMALENKARQDEFNARESALTTRTREIEAQRRAQENLFGKYEGILSRQEQAFEQSYAIQQQQLLQQEEARAIARMTPQERGLVRRATARSTQQLVRRRF